MIRLIHWNSAEASRRAELLRVAGHAVKCDVPAGPEYFRELRANPPAAVVIDLDRAPSQGRDVAVAIRHAKATRHVPIVFAGGEPEKVARALAVLPDAVATSWSRIRGALRQALAHPPANPVAPSSALAGYSGTPLPKKLGIKPNAVVGLVGAPEGFAEVVGALPEGASLVEDGRGRWDLTIWFTRSRAELERKMVAMAARAADGPLWIAWPKKTSGVATDLSEQCVRETGLGAGLVDYKICAIDSTWSGLLFARRRRVTSGR